MCSCIFFLCGFHIVCDESKYAQSGKKHANAHCGVSERKRNVPEQGEPNSPGNSRHTLYQQDAHLQHVCTLQVLKG